LRTPFSFTTPFDEATVRAAAEARAKIDVEWQVAHAKAMAQIGAILTTEQKTQLAARRPRRPEGPPPPPPSCNDWAKLEYSPDGKTGQAMMSLN
jgi:hypothetical protein